MLGCDYVSVICDQVSVIVSDGYRKLGVYCRAADNNRIVQAHRSHRHPGLDPPCRKNGDR
jgi:hypothetical protein